MIYFFDNELNMVKVATSKNVISAIHEHELNGLILGTVEADLSYTETFINDVDYFGYYYKDNYYLHKIKRVEHEHENELVRITGRHIFFEDMLYGDYIRDVRPVNRDALYILNQTISANTRWQTVMTDTSKLHSETYYWVPPMEVLNDLTENVGIEYEPKILFDGQKINGFQLHVANRIGEDKPIRVPFGSRVLNLKYEVDYSEIVTALYGHGKGEEVGDGYGRRINFSSVNFSRNGVVSPVGQLYMENPNVTAQYGKDDGSPKFGRIIFEDIESASELANATYESYLEQSRPKMLFEASVVDLGDVGMGDGVLIIRREYDVYFNARIHKLMVDLLDAENADVELGDYAHFKESKVQRKTRENNNQYRRETSSRIQQLKEQFNDRFDGEVNQMREDFEQALIDAHAEIQAAEQRMETLITTTRTEWTDTFNAEVAEIYRKADEDYNRIETEITGVIDSTRSEMETNFNSKVNDARTYAEQQAQEKANVVRTDLETVTSGHQSMLDALETNVMNIDDFIGSRDRTLQSILDEQRAEIEQKIEMYNKNYPNLVVGSTLENIDGFEPYQTTEIELRTEESLNYIRTYDVEGRNTLAYYFPDTVYLEQGNTYTIGVDFRSDSVEDLDYIYFMGPYNNVALTPLAQTRGLTADGKWHRYYFTFDWINTTRQARLMIGTNFNQGDTTRGWFDTRQVHVYKGDVHNIPWSPSPSDNAQIVSQLLYEMRQLEDGMSTLATKTEVDLLTGNVTQLTNEYHSTSEQVSSKLQNFDDVLGVNGSHFTQIAEQVQSKVWLNDVTDINPNLIPFADVSNTSDMSEYWSRFGANPSGSHATVLDSDGFYVFRDTVAESNLALQSTTFEEIKEGEQYTLSFLAKTHSNINDNYSYTYIINPSGNNHHLGLWTNRKHIRDNIYLYEWTFEARWTGEARVLIGSTTTSGTDARIRFKEPKLERGNVRTPFLNAFSNIEQLANKIALQVQELDGEYLSQSDIEINPGYVQLGSQRLGDSQLASIFRVSPNSIDAITSNLNLSGNLNTKGQITSLAVEAIEGNFARLWADEFSAITIDVSDISGLTARFEYLYTLNANIERLVSQKVFADGVTALVGNFVDINAGNIVTSGLSANVIESEHIAVGTALIDKMFATSARIDRLITKTHFVNEIQTLSLTAVRGDIADLRSRILTADVVNSTHLNVNAALANKFNANTAFIDRLEVKAANIRDLTGTHIRGGLLDSLNGATRLNLNTGDWTIGGSAKIIFTNRNNRIEYSNRGITAGMQFDHSLGSDGRPMTAVGVSDGAFDVNDSTFRGLIVHSLGTEGLLGYGSSIITQDGGFYTRTDRTGSGINFRLHATGSGAPRGIYPQYTGSYDYNLGSALNPWTQAYIRDIRTSGELWIRDWNGSGGWKVNTIADSGSSLIVLRGVNTNTWNYNLGSTTYRINAIYLRNSPNVSSDKRLKEDIKPSDLGLDFINGIEIKSFRKIVKEADINEGRLKNHIEFGLIAQQLRDNLISHGVDTEDIAMLSIDDDGYYGVQHEQLIAPTIRAVQDLDIKVESNTEKIARLEKEIETLKGA